MTNSRDKTVISYSKRRKRKRKSAPATASPPLKKIENEQSVAKLVHGATTTSTTCQFCLSSEDNEVDLGVIIQKHGFTMHYFCMLLSSGLCQSTRPSDRNSILGFTVPDIQRELRRGKRLNCCFCHKKGATIGCSVSCCRKAFHLSCGRRNGVMSHFFDDYRSFCADHWPKLDIGKSSPIKKRSTEMCSICFMHIGACKLTQLVLPPCCKRTYFHHRCMQKFALSAGMHYFRCPLCNTSKDFQKAMLSYGIYIPDRDASWERELNAFHELLQRPDSCSISPCNCPYGEKYTALSGDFKLLTCKYCGSISAHKMCAGITARSGKFTCPDCSEI